METVYCGGRINYLRCRPDLLDICQRICNEAYCQGLLFKGVLTERTLFRSVS